MAWVLKYYILRNQNDIRTILLSIVLIVLMG